MGNVKLVMGLFDSCEGCLICTSVINVLFFSNNSLMLYFLKYLENYCGFPMMQVNILWYK